MPGHAVIVGGGIAGLAAAAALRRRSWRVTVLERQPALAEVGAGITLWPNALRALDELGIGARIRSLGFAQVAGGIRESGGRWLAHTDTDALAGRFGDGIVVLERGELLAALIDACAGATIHTSVEARDVSADGTVRYRGSQPTNEFVTADVVIGADGLRSAVRQRLWPRATVRSTGMMAARLVGHLAGSHNDVGGESWGRGDYAGLAPLPDGRVYAYVVAPVSAGIPDEPEVSLAWWQRRFASWHSPIPQVLAATDPQQLLLNELYDLAPLPSLARGRVALVGDAGHAMTPNLGQGACQALEDAVELAAALSAGDDRAAVDADGCAMTQRLQLFSRHRLPRVRMVARRSRAAGQAAAFRGHIATATRNAIVRSVPASWALHGLDRVIGWRPPEQPETDSRT